MNKKSPLFLCLFVSLMANMFMGGIIISSSWMKSSQQHMPPPPPHRRGGGPIESFEQAKMKISPEGRKTVEGILKNKSKNMEGDMHGIRDVMHDAQRILTSKDFDAKSLEKTHNEMEEINNKIKGELSHTIYEIAVGLSDEDRIVFFEHALPKHRQRPPPPPRH